MIAARSLILAAVASLVVLTSPMQPASAVVPRDGYGFGITDPDPAVKRSLAR